MPLVLDGGSGWLVGCEGVLVNWLVLAWKFLGVGLLNDFSFLFFLFFPWLWNDAGAGNHCFWDGVHVRPRWSRPP